MRYVKLALKYGLAAIGGAMILGLTAIELRERRVGLGLGVCVVALAQLLARVRGFRR